MNDAYTIGITLSLDDEVSSGIAAIRGDLESLNQALGKSLSELADLRSAAGPALSSLWRASAAIRPAQTAKTPAVASGDTSSWPQAAPMPANPEAAPEWRAAERPAPVLPAHPFAPPPVDAPAYSEEQRNSRIEVLPFASDAIPPRVPDRAGAPIAPAPARATPAPAAPSAPDGLSLDDLLGFTHSMIARAPFAESPASVEDAAPEGGRTIVIGAAAAPLDTGAANPAGAAILPRPSLPRPGCDGAALAALRGRPARRTKRPIGFGERRQFRNPGRCFSRWRAGRALARRTHGDECGTAAFGLFRGRSAPWPALAGGAGRSLTSRPSNAATPAAHRFSAFCNEDAMSDVTLTLGPVLFAGFEIPPFLSFGGAQRLAVHRLPGGARVIDAMGRDDATISWSGIFTGAAASERVLLLDTLRGAGLTLPLSWDVFFHSVVISEFTAEYQAGWWIPYRIACTVVQDEVQFAEGLVATLSGQASNDLASAAGLAQASGIAFTGAENALAAPGATTLGTGAYLGAQNAVSSLQTSIVGGMGQAASALAGTATPLAGSNALAGASALSGATTAAGTLAGLAAAQGYVGRTATNLTNASS